MNSLIFSRALKFIGVLLLVCAYGFIFEYSAPSALFVTWIGLSIFTTSFLIDCNKAQTKYGSIL